MCSNGKGSKLKVYFQIPSLFWAVKITGLFIKEIACISNKSLFFHLSRLKKQY